MTDSATAEWDKVRDQLDVLATDLVLSDSGSLDPDRVLALLNEIRQLSAGIDSIDEAAMGMEQALYQMPSQGPRGFDESLNKLQTAINRIQTQTVEQSPVKAPPSRLAEDAELLQDFVLEAREHLTSIENELLKVEESPESSEPIHSVFRSFHTIKGLAGFLELDAIREVSHEVETVLDLARNGHLQLNSAAIDIVLSSADYITQAINAVENGLHGVVTEARPRQELISNIQGLVRKEPPQAVEDEPTPLEKWEAMAPPEIAQLPLGHQPKDGSLVAKAKKGGSETVAGNLSIRVETAKLDQLLEMVGELVIAQSLVRHDPNISTIGNPRLLAHLAQLSRITVEVQKTTMTLRMIPIGTLFQRMKRLVRDLARKAGKQAELDLYGEDTELDKTVVDGLADPLMHMIRNAVDHGIELPHERIENGKPATARITLRAYHHGGHMVIEIADDGRGLNRDKILAKAKQNGLIVDNTYLTEAEVNQLIFEPGFSTADKVTDISGRGVGMDVVKKNILKMRGRVDIQTAPSKGTLFSIRLPLTLAIIDGLIVGVGAHRYIVPIFSVTEMFRPTRQMLSTIENRREMIMVRGKLLPMIRLHKRFAVEPKSIDPTASLVIVADSEGKRFCLMVDEFIGKQEVVIKNLGSWFKSIPGVAGGAILGDGRIGLILEMAGLYHDQIQELR